MTDCPSMLTMFMSTPAFSLKRRDDWDIPLSSGELSYLFRKYKKEVNELESEHVLTIIVIQTFWNFFWIPLIIQN